MGEYLMNLLKPRIDQEKRDYAQQVAVSKLYKYVQDGMMPIDYAAKEAKREPSDFLADMRKAGYHVQEARA